MAIIIDTSKLTPNDDFSANEKSWIYNGLDCCLTYEIRDRLLEELNDSPLEVQQTYKDSLAKLAPVMEMGLRGFKVDLLKRDEAIREFERDLAFLEKNFKRMTEDTFDCQVNWRSPLQLKNFFYGTMNLKPIKQMNTKKVFAPSVNRNAMEKLCMYLWARPFALHVLAMRDLGKKIGFLKSEIDSDGRMRTNFNVAGTNTGRLSSSMSDFGSGTNLQNVSSTLRYPFVADEGKIIVNVDLEQADARNVGALIWEIFVEEAGEEWAGAYLNAAESGDLHTFVCRMAWANLDWPEDKSGWRAIADQIAYRDMSYRDLAKRLGHGTNYAGTPKTMAIHTKTDQRIIEQFQNKYFSAFPGIEQYHKWVKECLEYEGCIFTLYGRRRYFFGRAKEATTIREAIAYAPQSMTAHQIDMGYLNLWRNMPEVELLVQVHDSITFQLPYDGHEESIPAAIELLRYPFELKNGRMFEVPLDAKVGFNWGDVKRDKNNKVIGNIYGLDKWTGKEQRQPPKYLRRKTRLANLLK